MPQVDLEKRVVSRGGSGGDGRVTCESLFNTPTVPTPPHDHDLPAESFYLSKEDEFEWFNRNNVYYERKESTKGNITSTSTSTSLPVSHRSGNSKSTKSKASIIGLPKPQPGTFADPKSRRGVKTCTTRFFPKRLGSAAKFSLRLSEPSSPKVSCTGRVRSSRHRHRRSKSEEKTGFWSSFKQVFWLSCQRNDAVEVDGTVERIKSSASRKSVGGENRRKSAVEEEEANPPGLGGMNRFVSGRRSDSWAGDAVDLESVEHDDSYGPPKVV